MTEANKQPTGLKVLPTSKPLIFNTFRRKVKRARLNGSWLIKHKMAYKKQGEKQSFSLMDDRECICHFLPKFFGVDLSDNGAEIVSF